MQTHRKLVTIRACHNSSSRNRLQSPIRTMNYKDLTINSNKPIIQMATNNVIIIIITTIISSNSNSRIKCKINSYIINLTRLQISINSNTHLGLSSTPPNSRTCSSRPSKNNRLITIKIKPHSTIHNNSLNKPNNMLINNKINIPNKIKRQAPLTICLGSNSNNNINNKITITLWINTIHLNSRRAPNSRTRTDRQTRKRASTAAIRSKPNSNIIVISVARDKIWIKGHPINN